MQKRLYVGIDWGNEKHAICVMDVDGKIMKERMVLNDATAIQLLAELIGDVAASDVWIAVETRRIAIVEALMAHGYRIFTINPKQSERFRDRFNPAGAKDDRRDALVLASSLRTDPHCFHEVPPESAEQIELRTATRTEAMLEAEFRATANRLREAVLRAMPTLLELCPGADEHWFWCFIVAVMNPGANHVVDDDAIKAILKSNRIRRLKVQDVRFVLDKQHLKVADGVAAAAWWEIGILVPQLRLIEHQRKLVEKKIRASLLKLPTVGGKNDAEIVMSAPGFGEHCTAVLLVEASGAIATGNLNQLRAMSGVAPVTQGSGKRMKTPLVMMRRSCNGHLRNALHHAADAARRHPRFAPLYAKQRAEGASHARALRTIGDRLLKLILAMLKSRELFDPSRNVSVAS